MFKLFAKSEEKFVKGVMLYADSDKNLFVDADKEVAVTKDELINLFNKGMLVIADGDDFFKPTACVVESDYAEVSFVSIVSTAAAAVTYASDEHN